MARRRRRAVTAPMCFVVDPFALSLVLVVFVDDVAGGQYLEAT
jgi:hypothetical protein